MDNINKKDQLKYYKFLNSLPKKLNKLYFSKLKGKFKLNNKSKKKNGFDPVTNIDKAIEFFLRKEIKKSFLKMELLVKNLKQKNQKVDFLGLLIQLMAHDPLLLEVQHGVI